MDRVRALNTPHVFCADFQRLRRKFGMLNHSEHRRRNTYTPHNDDTLETPIIVKSNVLML